MFVQHADTPVRDRAPDAAGLGGAVDAEICIAAVLEQIERARPQRIGRATGLRIGIADEPRIGLGLPFDHLVRGAPGGPFLFDVDRRGAGKLQPRLADTHAVSHGLTGGGHQIQVVAAGQDQQLAHGILWFDRNHLRRGVIGGTRGKQRVGKGEGGQRTCDKLTAAHGGLL